jgi:hypothetical protein
LAGVLIDALARIQSRGFKRDKDKTNTDTQDARVQSLLTPNEQVLQANVFLYRPNPAELEQRGGPFCRFRWLVGPTVLE